eukprot:Clim_evm4s17 gene=Clim_evmTU4s17
MTSVPSPAADVTVNINGGSLQAINPDQRNSDADKSDFDHSYTNDSEAYLRVLKTYTADDGSETTGTRGSTSTDGDTKNSSKPHVGIVFAHSSTEGTFPHVAESLVTQPDVDEVVDIVGIRNCVQYLQASKTRQISIVIFAEVGLVRDLLAEKGHVPIVVVTQGTKDSELVPDLVEAGAFDFLRLPMSPALLVQRAKLLTRFQTLERRMAAKYIRSAIMERMDSIDELHKAAAHASAHRRASSDSLPMTHKTEDADQPSQEFDVDTAGGQSVGKLHLDYIDDDDSGNLHALKKPVFIHRPLSNRNNSPSNADLSAPADPSFAVNPEFPGERDSTPGLEALWLIQINRHRLDAGLYCRLIHLLNAANQPYMPAGEVPHGDTMDPEVSHWLDYEFRKLINPATGEDTQQGGVDTNRSSKDSNNNVAEENKVQSKTVDIQALMGIDYNPFKPESLELVDKVIGMFNHFKLLQRYEIRVGTMRHFLLAIRSKYHEANPYHNWIHGFDVAQMIFYIMTTCGGEKYFNFQDIFCLLLSAVCHDVDHPGVNNNYQIATRSDLAILYNDQSVLENHHCSLLFQTAQQPGLRIFNTFKNKEFQNARKKIISAILATDNSNHFTLMDSLNVRLSSVEEQPFVTNVRESKETMNKSRTDRQLLIQILLHGADISNVGRPLDLSCKWSGLVQEEFFQQGDFEKMNGIEVSPYMDREQPNQPRLLVNFIDFLVQPLFVATNQVISGIGDEILPNIEKCREYWADRLEDHKDSDNH